jgi:hypothetical protein
MGTGHIGAPAGRLDISVQETSMQKTSMQEMSVQEMSLGEKSMDVPGDQIAVRAQGLTKVYGEGPAAVHALKGVDLEVPRGESDRRRGRDPGLPRSAHADHRPRGRVREGAAWDFRPHAQ